MVRPIAVHAREAAELCGVSLRCWQDQIRPLLREIRLKPDGHPLYLVRDLERVLESRVVYTPADWKDEP